MSLIGDAIGRLLVGRRLRSPIFIVGINRTGKSLLHGALAQHPRILSPLGPHDTPLIGYFGGLVEEVYGDPDRRRYVEATTRMSRAQLYDYLRRLCFECAAGPHYGVAGLVKQLIRLDPSPLRCRYWCAETFPEEEQALGLRKLFPEALCIYTVRNGIDAVQARKDMLSARGQPVHFEAICAKWAASVRSYRYVTLQESGTSVRFEDLVAHPSRVIQLISTFLELRYSEAPALFVSQKLTQPDPDKPGRALLTGSELARRSSAIFAEWTEDQRRVFHDTCSSAMADVGYELPD